MGAKIVINLKSGMEIQGELARSFCATDTEIALITSPDLNKLVFSIDEIACVLLAGVPPWAKTREPSSFEEVQTTTGLTYNVAIYEGKNSPNGFFGVVQDVFPPEITIFFVHTGVRYRSQERLLGQILQEKGVITPEKMDEVLKQQQMLRNKRMGELIGESANISQAVIEKTLQDAANKSDNIKGARVGDILTEAGLVTREQVEQAFERQKTGKKMLIGELLITQGVITEDQLLEALATKFQMRFVDLKKIIPTDEALGALSKGLVSRLQVFPIEITNQKLIVATSKPTDPTVGDSIRFSTNLNIDLVVATSRQIADAIGIYYLKKDSISRIIDEMAADSEITIDEEDES